MVSHIPYISLDTYPKVRGTRIKDVAMLIPFTSRECDAKSRVSDCATLV